MQTLSMTLEIGAKNCKGRGSYCPLKKTCPCMDYEMDEPVIASDIHATILGFLEKQQAEPEIHPVITFTIGALADKLNKSKAWVVDWMTEHKIPAMPNNDGIEASYLEPQYMLTDEQYS